MTLNPADQAFQTRLVSMLGPDILRPVSEQYLSEPRGKYHGQAGCVVAPRNVDEVARIVQMCGAAGVGIVPFGGGTGLVSGQVLPEGPAPVVLSLERMTAVRAVSAAENVIEAEAGVTLAQIRATAADINRLFPLALASEGTCTVGGILSTNAGGSNTLRYGNARALCLGVEAVLPSGDIWHGLTPLRKDNMGYDLRDLLIGAEGTLGIITAASLRLSPRPTQQVVALLAVTDPQAALGVLHRAQDRLGEVISAYELMHRKGFEFLSETLPDLTPPFDVPPEWTVLLDVEAPAMGDANAAIEALLVETTDAGLVQDGWVAQSNSQAQAFWTLRESIPIANRRIGAISSHDISVPLACLPEFIRRANELVAGLGDYRINCFGHVGDGNLHFNVFPPKGHDRDAYLEQAAGIKRAVHGLVHELGGSISAEHGIGRVKVGDLERYGDPAKLTAMRAIKTAMDPCGIMNPGAVIR